MNSFLRWPICCLAHQIARGHRAVTALCARFVQWGWPLVVLITTIYVVWRWYFQAQQATAQADPWVWFGIGIVYAVVLMVIVVTTDHWSLRALGQVATYFADGVFYVGVGTAQYHWRHPLTNGEVNLGRAALAVGGPCLILGLLAWGFFRWREKRRERLAAQEALASTSI